VREGGRGRRKIDREGERDRQTVRERIRKMGTDARWMCTHVCTCTYMCVHAHTCVYMHIQTSCSREREREAERERGREREAVRYVLEAQASLDYITLHYVT